MTREELVQLRDLSDKASRDLVHLFPREVKTVSKRANIHINRIDDIDAM